MAHNANPRPLAGLFSKHPRLSGLAISAVVFLSLAAAFDHAVVEGPGDRGKLHLAVTTALLSGRPSPVTQRPPLYGAILAVIARAAGVSPREQRLDAREYGNAQSFPVALGLYSRNFLRLVLWFQLLLLIGTGWLVAFTLRFAGVGPAGILLALAVLALIAPEAPVNVLFDSLLTAFLLALGFCAWIAWLVSGQRTGALLLAAIAWSLAALSHAVFQLLPLFLMVLLYIPVSRRLGGRQGRRMAFTILLFWLVMVGGMSAYNLKRHQFFGLSSVMGSGLGTKTWPFIERAAPSYPDLTPVFLAMRDELLIKYYEHTGVYWGDSACQWLMRERGMSYVSANKFLLRFNLNAIRHGNEVYPPEVLQSLVLFMLPAFPYQIPGPLRIADYLAKALVFLVFAGGCAYRILGWAMGRGRKLLSPAQPASELVLAAAIAIFIYAALVVCAADMGKPGQRAPVLFIIPVVLPLILSQRKRKIRNRTRIPTPTAAEFTVEK